MKKKHIISIIALALIGLAVAACYGFMVTSMEVSDNPTANEYFTVTGTWSLDSSGGNQLLVPVLLPSCWTDVESTTEVYATCEAMGVKDLKLSYLDPTTCPGDNWLGLGLREYFNTYVGFMGNNYGEMTWHFFYTPDEVGEAPANSNIVVKAKIKAGAQNILFNASLGIAKYPTGPHGHSYPTFGDSGSDSNDPSIMDFERANGKVAVQISGGEGFEDYVSTPLVSTFPELFCYGDIFAVEFTTKVDDVETELYDMSDVYMHLIAVLPDGTTLSYDANDEKTLMKRIDDTTYRRYIYPKELFGLSQKDEISMMYVNFYSYDNTRKEVHGSLPGYMLSAKGDKIK